MFGKILPTYKYQYDLINSYFFITSSFLMCNEHNKLLQRVKIIELQLVLFLPITEKPLYRLLQKHYIPILHLVDPGQC